MEEYELIYEDISTEVSKHSSLFHKENRKENIAGRQGLIVQIGQICLNCVLEA